MTVTRHQALTQVTADFPNVTATAVDLPRPETTPKEPGYAETVDHVTRPVSLDEFYGGHCIVEMPSTLKLVTVFLRRAEIRTLLPTPQKGVATPANALFPSGAPTASEHVRDLVNVTGNVFPCNGDAVQDLFGLPHTTPATTVRSFPGVTLREGEYIRLTFYNNSGGALNDQTIRAVYKLGLNQVDTGRP
jgi:hypothetical protein